MLSFIVVYLQSGLAGGAAGALHVVSGPDHLAAVAPLAVRSPARALGTGAAWGFGHAAGVLALGGVGTLVRSFIHIEALSSWAEAFVGIVLIGIGGWGFLQTRKRPHADHDGCASHPHSEHSDTQADVLHEHRGGDRHAHSRSAAFGVGMIHGAAGTGHLLGVLPSLALPVPQAVAYLVSYGVAAVAAMSGFGFCLGLIGHRLRPTALLWLMRGAAAFACGLGAYWLGSSWPG